MQFCGSSWPDRIISSHLLRTLLKLNVEGMWWEIFAASPIAIPMQVCTQLTYSEVCSPLATTPECFFKIGDWQGEKKRRNGIRRAISSAMRTIDTGPEVIRHRGVSDRSDGAPPLWRSHHARTEMFFADDKMGVGCMVIWYGYFMLLMFLAALQFSTDTIMYLQQLSQCCQRSLRCKLIHFWLDNCLDYQYSWSGLQIVLMMQDEIAFTLNFSM